MASKETRRAILNYIEKNSKADLRDLAIMLGTDEVTIANEIQNMEKDVANIVFDGPLVTSDIE